MRQIPPLGGLAFGVEGGPQLDIIPIGGTRLSPKAILARVREELVIYQWLPLSQGPPFPGTRNKEGFYGAGSNFSVRLSWPRGMKALDALYDIERVEWRELPPWLLSTLYLVHRGLEAGAPAERLSPGIQVMVSLMSVGGSQSEIGYSRLSSREIKRLAEDLIQRPTLDVNLPAGSVDRARFWLAVSRALWREDVMRRMAETTFSPQALGDAAAYIGPIHLMLSAVAGLRFAVAREARVQIRGVGIVASTEGSQVLAWPQALEWVAGDISPEALRWISQGRFPDSEPRVDDFSIQSPISAALMQGMAEALLEEARENAAYIPYGQFTLRLPADNPLAPWGVKRLRVWAEPDRLWVQFVGKGSKARGASLEWRPDRPMRPFVISENSGAVAAAHLVFAALWHDLVTAATAALPEQDQEPPKDMVAEVQARERARREGHARGRGRSYRTLPRKKKVRIRGRRDWSTAAERKRIMRRHRVSGHLRQLPKGWHASEEAQRWARRYGFIVPQGYTFVRPHMRGSDERDVETVVVARGLEALMLLNAGAGKGT